MSEIFGFHFNERVNWARKINFFTNMAPYYLKKKKKRKEMWLREITIKTDFYNSAKYGGHLRVFFFFWWLDRSRKRLPLWLEIVQFHV